MDYSVQNPNCTKYQRQTGADYKLLPVHRKQGILSYHKSLIVIVSGKIILYNVSNNIYKQALCACPFVKQLNRHNDYFSGKDGFYESVFASFMVPAAI